MKTIKFSEGELEFLKNHYELELQEAENYIAEIKNILKKLGREIKAEASEKPKKKRGRPPKTKDEGRGTTAYAKASALEKDENKIVEAAKEARKKPGPKPKKEAVIARSKETKQSEKPTAKPTLKKKATPKKKAAPKKKAIAKAPVKKAEVEPAEHTPEPTTPTENK